MKVQRTARVNHGVRRLCHHSGIPAKIVGDEGTGWHQSIALVDNKMVAGNPGTELNGDLAAYEQRRKRLADAFNVRKEQFRRAKRFDSFCSRYLSFRGLFANVAYRANWALRDLRTAGLLIGVVLAGFFSETVRRWYWVASSALRWH